MIQLINLIFFVLQILILARVLLSWVRPDPYNPVVRLIYDLTEPIMEPVRRLIPPMGGLDIGPIIVLLGLNLIQRLLLSLVV